MGLGPFFKLFVAAALTLLAASREHEAPVENLAAPQAQSDESVHQTLLSEMWQRRIISSETRSWTAEDLDALLKVRAAEELGAVNLLKRRVGGPLGGLVAPFKPAGAQAPVLRLTRDGYDRWRFYRSQDAIQYFENKGVETGSAFQLEDLDGKRLFDAGGSLTAAGDEVYNRALANLPTWWKLPRTGEIFGTRPPSQAKKAAPEAEPDKLDAYPVTVGPEHAAIMQQLGAKYGRPYQPQVRVAELGRLRVVMEYEPSNAGGSDAYVVVVAKDKDKRAARKELRARLPQLGPIPVDKIVTLEQKLAGMDRNLARLSKQAEAGGHWTVDRAAVEKQLRELLKGKLAVAWVLSSQEPPADAAPAPDAAAPAPDGAAAHGKPSGPPASATEAAPPEPAPQPQTQARP